MWKLIPYSLLLVLGAASHAQNLAGKLLYSVSNRGVDSIYALERDGRTTSYITEGFRPRLSHNGHMLAFSRNRSNPNGSYGASLYLRDLTLNRDSLVFNQGDYLDYYDFLPSDKKLIYSQTCAVYSVTTGGATRDYATIGCNPCDCYSDDPVVRIQDSLVAYHNVHFGLYRMRANGDSSRAIPHTYAGDLYPVFSLDGNWLAYTKNTPGRGYYVQNNLHKIRPSGADSTALTHLSATDTIVPDPVWAADGASLYILARIGGQSGLYRVQANGTGSPTLLKPFPNALSIWRYTLGLADSIRTQYVASVSPSASEDFELAPNPAGHIVTLRYGPATHPQIEVYDALGRLCMAQAGSPSEARLNLGTLPPGSYQIRLRTEGGVRVRRLVIQR